MGWLISLKVSVESQVYAAMGRRCLRTSSCKRSREKASRSIWRTRSRLKFNFCAMYSSVRVKTGDSLPVIPQLR